MTPNQSHGHVTPNADGSRTRCGGPTICNVCMAELAQLQAKSAPAEVAQGEVEIVAWLLEHEKGARAVDLNSQAMQVMQQSVGGIISALITVAQHNRIMADLTANRDALLNVMRARKMLPKCEPSPDAELVELLRGARAGLDNVGLQDTYIDYDAVSAISTRIDAKLASLKGVEE